MHPRCITGRQEARNRRAHDNRIAHQHISFGLTNTNIRPRHRHQPHRAVKIGHIEGDFGAPLGIDAHQTAEIRHQLFGGGWALHPHPGGIVTARPHSAHRAIHAVNQATIDIAQFHAEATLTEIVARWIGAIKGSQVEDAEINGG